MFYQRAQRYVFGVTSLFGIIGAVFLIRRYKKFLKENNRKYEDEISNYKTQLEQCCQEKHSLEVIRDNLKYEHEKTIDRLTNSQNDVENIQTETYKKCLEDINRKHDEEISNYKILLEKCRLEKTTLEVVSDKIKDEHDNAVDLLKRSQSDVENLETEICKLQQEQKDLEKQLNYASKKLEQNEETIYRRRRLQNFIDITFDKSPKPLHNLGNTCFMDAMLQNLAWCPKLGNELQRQIVHMMDVGNEVGAEVTASLFNLVCYCHSRDNSKFDKTSVPNAILQAARKRNDVFNGNKQQDSFEMFNTIINGLKDEILDFTQENDNINQESDIECIMKNYGAVRLFYGKFISVFCYSSCKHVESVFQSFTSITVPVKKRPEIIHDKSNPCTLCKKPKESKSKKKKAKKHNDSHKRETDNLNKEIHIPEDTRTNLTTVDVVDVPIQATTENTTEETNEDLSEDEFYDAQEQFKTVVTQDTMVQTENGERADKCINTENANIYSNKLEGPFDSLGYIKPECTDIEYGLYTGFMNVETFGEDIMSCRKCKPPGTTGICSKKTLISEAPYVLVLHIDRFKENHKGGLVKRNELVTYPNILDLKPFCSVSMKMSSPITDSDLMYNLYGVVSHSGSLNSGHYVAYIKTSGRSKALWYQEIIGKYWKKTKNHKKDIESYLEGQPSIKSDNEPPEWYYISDEHIMLSNENEALDNPNAYVLMYERL